MTARWVLAISAALGHVAAPVSTALCMSYCMQRAAVCPGYEAGASVAPADCHRAAHLPRGSSPTGSGHGCMLHASAATALTSAGAAPLPAPQAAAIVPGARGEILAAPPLPSRPATARSRAPASVHTLTTLRI